jgi:hypothetical protein
MEGTGPTQKPDPHTVQIDTPNAPAPQKQGELKSESKIFKAANWGLSMASYWTPRVVIAYVAGHYALGYLDCYHAQHLADLRTWMSRQIMGDSWGRLVFQGSVKEITDPYINNGVITVAGGAAACAYGLCEGAVLKTVRAAGSAFQCFAGLFCSEKEAAPKGDAEQGQAGPIQAPDALEGLTTRIIRA